GDKHLLSFSLSTIRLQQLPSTPFTSRQLEATLPFIHSPRQQTIRQHLLLFSLSTQDSNCLPSSPLGSNNSSKQHAFIPLDNQKEPSPFHSPSSRLTYGRQQLHFHSFFFTTTTSSSSINSHFVRWKPHSIVVRTSPSLLDLPRHHLLLSLI
ncbi:unnamed protein product, partial [Linum tenue]